MKCSQNSPLRALPKIAISVVLATSALFGCLADDGMDDGDVGLSDAGRRADTGDAHASDASTDPTPPPAVEVERTEARQDCLDRNPSRNLYWGDLHVHTARSFDAYFFGVRNEPADAYEFARGAEIALPPLDAMGQGTQRLRLDRPLDFAAITDHSEFLAEIDACTNPASPAYATSRCASYRASNDLATLSQFGGKTTDFTPERFRDLCGPDGIDCGARARDVWARIQDDAEAAYDRSEECRFTSLIAYEWTGAPGISNMHRNVVFRNDDVPSTVVSYFEEQAPHGLWQTLHEDCLDADGACDVLAIPHNSNTASGNMFRTEYPGTSGLAEERERAATRRVLEPLVEIFQHKGDSECVNGISGVFGPPDELCDFEKLHLLGNTGQPDCLDGSSGGGIPLIGCISRHDFVRTALVEGLREETRLGINPFELGIIASTDSHNGTPGAVAEDDYRGHWGNNEDTPLRRLDNRNRQGIPGGRIYSPGGLAAVWAIENSRDAIFEALRRRETYGTSGPRMAVRLFAGQAIDPGACGRPDLVEHGYAAGVPMGGIMELDAEAARPPTLVVQAAQDVGGLQTPLQRVQIVKGTARPGGEPTLEVFDVAGDRAGEDTLDTTTCEHVGEPGHSTLCATWTDPDFDPAASVFYYARVLEIPTCRWSRRECNRLPVGERPPGCVDPSIPDSIQERAWTSPIWYYAERPRGD